MKRRVLKPFSWKNFMLATAISIGGWVVLGVLFIIMAFVSFYFDGLKSWSADPVIEPLPFQIIFIILIISALVAPIVAADYFFFDKNKKKARLKVSTKQAVIGLLAYTLIAYSIPVSCAFVIGNYLQDRANDQAIGRQEIERNSQKIALERERLNVCFEAPQLSYIDTDNSAYDLPVDFADLENKYAQYTNGYKTGAMESYRAEIQLVAQQCKDDQIDGYEQLVRTKQSVEQAVSAARTLISSAPESVTSNSEQLYTVFCSSHRTHTCVLKIIDPSGARDLAR